MILFSVDDIFHNFRIDGVEEVQYELTRIKQKSKLIGLNIPYTWIRPGSEVIFF